MRVAIYCRVSTSKQAPDGTEDEDTKNGGSSLDTQDARCRAYADSQGWTIVRTFREVYSGAYMWQRPMLTDARELVRTKQVDVLLSFALDRLSRKQTHIAIVAEECERAGVRLAFVTESFEDGAVGTFLRSATAFAAELEREKIAERTARGKENRARGQHRLLPAGRALYGYQWQDDSHSRYVPNPATAPIVQRIFSDVATGTAMRRVAINLTQEGILTATGLTRWIPATIKAIINHPGYMGVAYALCWRRNGMRRDMENAVTLPEGTIVPLVDKAMWDAAQAAVVLAGRHNVRNNQHPHAALMRGGIAKCGICGKSMHVHYARSSGQFRYRCGGAMHNPGSCTAHNISVERLDTAVWNAARSILNDPSIIAREVERLAVSNPDAANLDAIERTLADMTRRQGNFIRELGNLDDADTAAPIRAEIASIAKRKKELAGEKVALAARQREWETVRERLADIAAWCAGVNAKLDTLTYEQKRLAIDALGVRAVVYRADHAPWYEIEAHVPLNSGVGEAHNGYSPTALYAASR